MRDVEVIDSELRLLAVIRQVCREESGRAPSTRLIDALLDERRELAFEGDGLRRHAPH